MLFYESMVPCEKVPVVGGKVTVLVAKKGGIPAKCQAEVLEVREKVVRIKLSELDEDVSGLEFDIDVRWSIPADEGDSVFFVPKALLFAVD